MAQHEFNHQFSILPVVRLFLQDVLHLSRLKSGLQSAMQYQEIFVDTESGPDASSCLHH